MALLGQATKPEDILGMSQEEFKKRLDGGATKEDLASLAEENKKTASSLDEIKAALAALKPAAAEPVLDPGDPTTDLLTDPTGFINKSTRGLQDAQLQTQADLQEMRARQNPEFSGIFAKYGKDLIERAAGMSIAQRANPNFWAWHIRTVVGDKLIKGEIKAENYPSLIGTSSVGPNVGDTSNPGDRFTQEQRDYFKSRGIPLDKAAAIQKLYDDGEQISMANVKKAANA